MTQAEFVHPSQDPAGALARMVAHTRFEDIPASLVELARKAIFDTLSVTIAGSSWEVCPAIVDQAMEWGGAPQSRVAVYGHRLPAPLAAFANGVMARAIDMGDVHETGGHVSEWNVPVMLSALGLAGRRITGRDFITAYVVGAELSVRCSAALNLVRYQTTRGMPGEWYGALCGAASAARLLDCTADETWNALGMCYSVHSMSEHSKYAEGTQMARVQHSFAGDTAIKSVLLTRRGVTAPRGIFQGYPGGILHHLEWDDVQPELLTEGLGTRWHLGEGLSMKPYSACKFTHSFIASAAELVRVHGIDHREIAAINCRGSDAARMTFEPAEAKWNPRSVPEAMFSAPYAIATAVMTGGFFLGDLTREAIDEPARRALMSRVTIAADRSISEDFEGYWVEIALRDGHHFEMVTPYTKGHTRNPLSWDDQAEKLRRCAAYAARPFSEGELRRLEQLCRSLDRLDDATMLLDAMVPGGMQPNDPGFISPESAHGGASSGRMANPIELAGAAS